ncbi:RING-box protein 2-like [Stegodyphus dumicola]|uniref:RING-box protein 2-like n=1 Tax=Stegodyphus dumicola TaxID=202533 RepID=UPI0015B1DBBC|nr:RING-box protein 2-like [Stegodyphus dumicola]
MNRDTEDVHMADDEECVDRKFHTNSQKPVLFTLKNWNAVAMWSWDVECDTCAICRVQVMNACLRCQAENKQDDCVVVWGECNHSFHNCCMSLWVKKSNTCPMCQRDWLVQRIGK